MSETNTCFLKSNIILSTIILVFEEYTRNVQLNQLTNAEAHVETEKEVKSVIT